MFSSRLRELREAASLTQSELADAAGLSRDGIAHLEQGRRSPTLDVAQRLAAALGVGVQAFDGVSFTHARQAGKPAAKKVGRGRPRKSGGAG